MKSTLAPIYIKEEVIIPFNFKATSLKLTGARIQGWIGNGVIIMLCLEQAPFGGFRGELCVTEGFP